MDKHCFYKYNRSMTLLENSDKFNPAFEQILERSYNMFNNNSYLYQYYKYGLEREKFLDCFSTLENVILNYSKLWFLYLIKTNKLTDTLDLVSQIIVIKIAAYFKYLFIRA